MARDKSRDEVSLFPTVPLWVCKEKCFLIQLCKYSNRGYSILNFEMAANGNMGSIPFK